MQQYLLDILKSPSQESIDKVEQSLNTDAGQQEFISLLVSNNVIAYSYMKMKIKDWISNNSNLQSNNINNNFNNSVVDNSTLNNSLINTTSNRINFLIKYKNTFYNLITDTTDYNLNLLSDTFEIMYYHYVTWPDFIDYLVQLDNPRAFKVLNSLFKKYRVLNRCDQLYIEIISNVNKVAPLFIKYYQFSNINSDLSNGNTLNVNGGLNNDFTNITSSNINSNYNTNSNKPLEDINLLNILYSLIYQDIHPFFESNIDKLVTTLTTLYKETSSYKDKSNKEIPLQKKQPLINEIYNLIINKYSDIVDLTKIFGSVIISLTCYDLSKYTVLNNIIKKKTDVIFKFEDVLINAIKLGSILSDKEKDEMITLEYSRNILNNVDIYRGVVIEMIWCIKKVSKEIFNKLVLCCGGGELDVGNFNTERNIEGNNSINSHASINSHSINSHASINNTTINAQHFEEWQIFIYTALKLNSPQIIKFCKLSINNSNTNIYISFASFRYLLVIKEYCTFDYRIINRNHPACYLSMVMLIQYLQCCSPVEKKILEEIYLQKGCCENNCTKGDENTSLRNSTFGNIPFRNTSIGNSKEINYIDIIKNLSVFISADIEDEYSTLLINRIAKDNPNAITETFYDQLVNLCIENILNINSVTAYSYIFDTLSILYISGSVNILSNASVGNINTSIGNINKKIKNDILKIVNLVVSEEIVELYSSTFFMLSVLILRDSNTNNLYSNTDYSNMVQIVSQTALWSAKELYLSLICLTISLYKRQYMTDTQINYIIQYLCNINMYYAFILSDNTTRSVQVIEDIEELFIFKSVCIGDGDDTNLDGTSTNGNTKEIESTCGKNLNFNKEEYIKIYKTAMEYFNANYITKKNARRVSRACLRGSRIVKDEMYKNIIEKNMFNLGYDNVPYSVYISFDI